LKITILYVGSSLLAPLKQAEREINRVVDLRVSAYNFGSPLSDHEWVEVENDLGDANVVFVIHVMDGENAARLISALDKIKNDAVIVINCMPELMRRTRMGRLDIATLGDKQHRKGGKLLRSVGSWVGNQARRGKSRDKHTQYLKLVDRLPGILKFVPTAGALTDAKHYLYLFCYFLQPTPANIQAMLLYALVHYVHDERLRKIRVPKPEQMPSVAIYHPGAPKLFQTFAEYRKWYRKPLNRGATIGLLLMRPQVISKTTKHYDALINAIEAQGLSVIPAIATLMDNREAVSKFFVETGKPKARVSQIVSLTGFSFVGGPAMNDSAAAAEFLRELNIPYRSAVSLDTQTIEAWTDSQTGLNPVQAGMQIAIPEIDGATEPFIYGGIPTRGQEPIALDDRCERLARRLKRWHTLQTASRKDVKLAIVLFCFPPNKGNIGTAADLDVFPGVFDVLKRLDAEGYRVELPDSADDLRERLIDNVS
jgi:magnesium chelatase subunit H